jgi:hypothetical protein
MKLRVTQPGYENFTGMLGSMHFTNGVSNDDVSAIMAAGMANIVRCEMVENVVAAAPKAVVEQPAEQPIEQPADTTPALAGDTQVQTETV